MFYLPCSHVYMRFAFIIQVISGPPMSRSHTHFKVADVKVYFIHDKYTAFTYKLNINCVFNCD
jgi:hypothetical protein